MQGALRIDNPGRRYNRSGCCDNSCCYRIANWGPLQRTLLRWEGMNHDKLQAPPSTAMFLLHRMQFWPLFLLPSLHIAALGRQQRAVLHLVFRDNTEGTTSVATKRLINQGILNSSHKTYFWPSLLCCGASALPRGKKIAFFVVLVCIVMMISIATAPGATESKYGDFRIPAGTCFASGGTSLLWSRHTCWSETPPAFQRGPRTRSGRRIPLQGRFITSASTKGSIRRRCRP